MADNRNNGGDESMSQWFSMYPNHQQQQQQQQQTEPQELHQEQSTMIDNATNVYNTVAVTQHPQQSEDHLVPQYANQYQSQLRPLEANFQVHQQRGTFQQQISSQQCQHNQPQYQRQPYSDYQQHSGPNVPTRMTQAQQSVINTHGGPVPIGIEDRNGSQYKAQIRSERKRTREKQRRNGVNKKFAELAKILKRLKFEEREEVNRNTKTKDGNANNASSALHTVHLPYVAPNNTVDLIASASIYLQHLQQVSKRQQEVVNRLENELENTKKAGEDTASKLKDVLFNCQMPRPHPGLTNPNFDVNNNSSSKGDTNRGDVSNSNTQHKVEQNLTPTIGLDMASMMNGELQQNQHQLMMMLPMMMNMGSTATIMGQGTACNMPNIAMQTVSAGSLSPHDNAFPSSTQGTVTKNSSKGDTSSSSNIPLNSMPRERSSRPLQQPTLGQYSTQHQQDGNVQQDLTKKPSDKK